MEITDIILQRDISKLNSDDIIRLAEVLNLGIPKNESGRNFIFSNLNDIFQNNIEARKLILNKIFLGITSIKWYLLTDMNDEKRIQLVEKIENLSYYNQDLNSSINLDTLSGPTCYTCVKLDTDKYLFRFFSPDREVKEDNGIEISKKKKNKNVMVLLDTKENYFEIRSDSKTALKIMNKLKNELELTNITEKGILFNYGGCLETFTNSLNEGKFVNVKSIPSSNIDITPEDTSTLIETLKILDDFFIERDYSKLVNELMKIEITTDGLAFTQLFLAGMEKIGITIRDDSSEDMSNQLMYKMLESYIVNQSGYIKFKDILDEKEYTIQVGLNTNSIVFRSEATESAVNYIREKLL